MMIMMKCSVATLVVLVLGITLSFEEAEAGVARAQFKNSGYPNKCVLDYNTILSPGQTGKAPNNPCAGVTCMQDGHVLFKTCPAVAPPKGCKMRDFVNAKRDYPECCERAYDCSSSF